MKKPKIPLLIVQVKWNFFNGDKVNLLYKKNKNKIKISINNCKITNESCEK